MRCLAGALARKWRIACQECQPARDTLDSLTASSDPEKVKLWLLAAQRAASERRRDIKVMDIYEVHAERRKLQRHSEIGFL